MRRLGGTAGGVSTRFTQRQNHIQTPAAAMAPGAGLVRAICAAAGMHFRYGGPDPTRNDGFGINNACLVT